MWVLTAGLISLALKCFEVGPVGQLPWWIVLIPFGLAVLWWTYTDTPSYINRRVINREAARKQARIDRQRANLKIFDSKASRSYRQHRK